MRAEIELLSNQLEGCNWQPTQYHDPEVSFYHSTDSGLIKIPNILQKQVFDHSALGVGLVVGTGGLLSIIPALDEMQAVLVVDKDPRIIEWHHYILDALSRSGSVKDYYDKVYSPQNPIYNLVSAGKLEGGLLGEKQDLISYHYLYSENRFKICAESLKCRRVVLVCGDLTNRLFMETLASKLKEREAVISWSNLTNVGDYCFRYLRRTLPVLPFTAKAAVFSSSFESSIPLSVRVNFGIEAYLKQLDLDHKDFLRI